METPNDEGVAGGTTTLSKIDQAVARLAANPVASKGEDGLLQGIPILDCVFDPDTCLVQAWCVYCGVLHQHGVPTYRGRTPQPDEILGHRVAHCYVEDSPYRARGYYLRFACVKKADEPKKKRRTGNVDPCKGWGDRVVSFAEAAGIVDAVAAQDSRYFLTKVVPEPDKYWNTRTLALCHTPTMTIRVPDGGVSLGSLVSELALLLVSNSSPLLIKRNYQMHKAGIAKLVAAAAGVTI